MESRMAGGILDLSGVDWTDLPSLIVGEILDRLPPIDRCRLRAVCRCWKEEVPNHSIYRPYLKSRDDPCDGQPQAPWLMVPVEDAPRLRFCKVPSPSPSPFPLSHLPPIEHVAGTSPGGWILHVDGHGNLHALNLFTLEELHAPPLAISQEFSSLLCIPRHPNRTLLNMVNPYLYAIIYFPKPSRSEGRRYAFVLPRPMCFAWEGDKSWTTVDEYSTASLWSPRIWFHSMLPHDGRIYGIKAPFVCSFDLSGSRVKDLHALVLEKDCRYTSHEHVPNHGSFLAEISGKLWLFLTSLYSPHHMRKHMRKHMPKPMPKPMPKHIESFVPIKHHDTGTLLAVIKVLMFKLDKDANVWRQESNFGAGMALFLGSAHQSRALKTCNFPHLQPGSIYFTDRVLTYDLGILVYNVEEKTCKSDPRYPTEKLLPPFYQFNFPVWMLY